MGVVIIAPPLSISECSFSVLSTLRTKFENKHFNILTFDLQFLFPPPPRIPPAFQATSSRPTMMPPSPPPGIPSFPGLPSPNLNNFSSPKCFFYNRELLIINFYGSYKLLLIKLTLQYFYFLEQRKEKLIPFAGRLNG